IITHTISITRTPQLQSVDFPDHHRVELKYGDMRVDLSGDQILSKIDVLFNGRYISEHQLTTSYFIQNRYGTPNSPFQKQCARLCLQAVRRLGVDLKDEEPPYQFDYYLGSSAPYDFVPPPYYYMKDIWGYYNGDYSVDASNNPIAPTTAAAKLNFQQVKGLCYMRNNDVNAHLYTAKAGYAKNGLLKNIFYPAGGKLTYYYDQNMAMVNGQSVAVGGVHVSKTQVSDGGFSNGCGNPLETNYNYYTDFTHAQSSLLVSQTPWNSMATPTNSYDPDGWYPYFRLPFHVGCDYHFKYPGILQLEQAVSLTANQQFWQAFFKVVDVVGAVMDVMDVVNVCLDATPAAIIAVVMDVIGVVFEFVFTCTADLHRENAETIVYSSDVNAANPLPACYTRLEVTEGSGTDGTTVYEFTSPADYPVWIPDNGDHTYNTTWAKYTMEQRFPYWAYGQIKKVTQVDPSNNKIKETENVFDPSFLREEYIDLSKQHFGDVNPQSCKCDLVKENSMRNDNWSDPTNFDPATTYVTGYDADNGIRPFFYGYYHGRLPLATTYERTFKPGDPSHWQQTETDYLYNTKNFQPSMITTTQSNGDQSEKQLTYTVDYNNNSSTILYSMAQNYNMVNDEVSSSMWVYKPSIHTAYLLDEKVTEFMTVATGAIKPARTMEQRFSQPQTSAALYNGPGSSSNPTYKQTAAFSYDGSGNVTGVVDEAGRVATNIYDYYDKFVTASAVNADAVQDKVAYTSFETSSLGGWTLSSGAPVGGTAVTGSQYLPLAGGSLTANINSSKPYILSFWATGTGVTATGTLVKSAPTINGYTYFEYSIAQGVSSVAVTGNGNIDELRLYPKMSRMRSSTYDPLVGKTAECDENNRITYFEYDGVGRLRLVKDESGNILKMFEYNYANNNQASCTVTYYNNAISEQFVKQNCSGSTIGKPYTYTIPQNKYSSTLSQAAADQQAQAELDDLGQSTADAQVVSNYCQAIWWNDPQSAPFTPDICPEGYKGTPVTYSVPGHRYSSLISLDDANQQALDEIQANGWAYANNMPSICMVDTAGDWIGDVTTQHCLSNGDKTMVYTDNNPNSPSYGHTQTIDMGADSSCPITLPPPPTVYAKLF
ncbi:MAG: hypothetical protein JST42_14355, partial [Bacteroidetes bacterium]|nr:hypothetical protein [Bacteroidota bacterium]